MAEGRGKSESSERESIETGNSLHVGLMERSELSPTCPWRRTEMRRLKQSGGKGVRNSGREKIALEGRRGIPYSKMGEKEERLRNDKGKIS